MEVSNSEVNEFGCQRGSTANHGGQGWQPTDFFEALMGSDKLSASEMCEEVYPAPIFCLRMHSLRASLLCAEISLQGNVADSNHASHSACSLWLRLVLYWVSRVMVVVLMA